MMGSAPWRAMTTWRVTSGVPERRTTSEDRLNDTDTEGIKGRLVTAKNIVLATLRAYIDPGAEGVEGLVEPLGASSSSLLP